MFIQKTFQQDIPAVLSSSNERQAVFVGTVMAYSRAVSRTVQAEVQQFSSPVSPTSSNMKSCSATPSSSSSVKKRAIYTIHDFLADNESCIIAFEKLDKFIVNGIDVVLGF